MSLIIVRRWFVSRTLKYTTKTTNDALFIIPVQCVADFTLFMSLFYVCATVGGINLKNMTSTFKGKL